MCPSEIVFELEIVLILFVDAFHVNILVCHTYRKCLEAAGGLAAGGRYCAGGDRVTSGLTRYRASSAFLTFEALCGDFLGL